MVARWSMPDLNARGAIILISGRRQAGKTTLLLAVRDAAIAAGRSTGGVISVARFAEGRKTGIDLLDAATGARMPLAHYVNDLAVAVAAVHTKHYVFDSEGLAAGQRAAEAGRGADLYFVDELGPLELQRGEGWTAAVEVVRARDFGCALVVVRPELLGDAYRRLALADDTPVLAVESSSRDRLRDILVGWVRGQASG